MYSKHTRRLLTTRYPNSAELPAKLRKYLDGGAMSEELFGMIAHWLSNLEKRLYKKNKLRRHEDYERRVDRVILFLQYAREKSQRDTPYIMSVYKYLFPYAEVVLQCRVRRLALPECESTLRLLTHPDVRFIRVYNTIVSTLNHKGIPINEENITACWKGYNAGKGKVPGKLAIENFRSKVAHHQEQLAALILTEGGWASRSGI